jgi:hypothetical protein
MCGYPIARDYKEAMEFDEQNGKHKWQQAINTKMEQLDAYQTFLDIGQDDNIPNGYKRIRTDLVFAVKHSGKFKAKTVADGHLTDTPLESVYSAVVSLRSLRLVLFLSEPNGMPACVTDLGNPHLGTVTREKFALVADPEFVKLQGHTLIVYNVLYRLKLSGKMWYKQFADWLKSEGFKPSKADPCVWMSFHEGLDVYEYIAVYVDDLALSLHDTRPSSTSLLQTISSTSRAPDHLSSILDVTSLELKMGSSLWLQGKTLRAYEQMFGEKPRKFRCSSLSPRGDHPEMDASDFLDVHGTTKYQPLIGMMQWFISLGLFDPHCRYDPVKLLNGTAEGSHG